MKRALTFAVSTLLLFFGMSVSATAYANGDQIPCEKVGADPNVVDCFWFEGKVDGTWKGYWYTVPKPTLKPEPEPVKETEKPKFQETCSTTDTSDPKKAWSCVNSQGFITEYKPTQITQEPTNENKVTTSPVVVGSRNIVSTVTNTTNNNLSSVVNSSVNNIVNKTVTSNVISNSLTQNDMRVISVSGGYLIIGENGFGKFFPSKTESTALSNKESDEIVYLEKSDLPKNVARAVDRLPESIAAKKSVRLPLALRNAESVTEDVCSVSNRKLETLLRGTCVLEIPVGEGIYEHEVKITK
jgi:hypothetical protein